MHDKPKQEPKLSNTITEAWAAVLIDNSQRLKREPPSPNRTIPNDRWLRNFPEANLSRRA